MTAQFDISATKDLRWTASVGHYKSPDLYGEIQVDNWREPSLHLFNLNHGIWSK